MYVCMYVCGICHLNDIVSPVGHEGGVGDRPAAGRNLKLIRRHLHTYVHTYRQLRCSSNLTYTMYVPAWAT